MTLQAMLRHFTAPFLLTTALAFSSASATAQTLVLTNGVRTFTALTNTTLILSNRCELRLTASSSPMPGCVVNLNSADACLALPNLKPSTVVASHLSQVRVNGAAAVADSNCRVVQYAMGAIVLPHAPGFQPLQVFNGPYFSGVSMSLSQYVYYTGASLGALEGNISSFKLRRGYQAVFAQTVTGTGISQCYVAQDGDLEVSLLPMDFDNSVRFVFVVPWRWTGKKGIAGNVESGLNLQWKYNWNLDQNSTRDLEYVPIRQNRWWPGLSQDWKARGANHLLGYNEPDKSDQADLAVADAIASWPDLLGTGLRVGSPATSDGGRSSWLYPFMEQADAADLRVDFVAVHYYWCYNPSDAAGAANQMYNFLKATYDTVKRPLWITEWNNGANWTGCGDPTHAQQQAAIAAMLDMLDNTPFVERYALYNWVEDVRRVKWDDGSLTSAGTTYRDKVSPLSYVQAYPNVGSRSFAQLLCETSLLDTTGYGNNGVAAGSPAYTNGLRGQALVFDGANTVVTLSPNVANGSSFTFAAWVKWHGGSNWQRIFDFGNSTTHYLFLSPSASGSNLRFAIKSGGSEQIVQTGTLPAGSWQHVAVTLSGSTARLYLNGAQVAVNSGMTITPASFSPRVNRLGKSHFTADPLFNGLMDEVLITDYALSAAQIASLLTNRPPQFTNSLIVLPGATEGIPYSASLAGAVTDADAGSVLTFSKPSGPGWLSVSSDGTLSGTPSFTDGGTNYFIVRVIDPAGQNGFAVVAVPVTTLTANGTWIADATSAWSTPSRWSGNIVATGAGRTADFSTINITANRTVVLDTPRTIGTLRFGDTSGSQWWTLASGGSALTLSSGSATSPSIVVTNTTVVSAPLAGTNGFTKSGPGTLILSGNNPLSGTVRLDAGSSTANDGVVRASSSGALANATLLQFRNSNDGTSTLELDGSAGSITINAPLAATCRGDAAITLRNLAGTNYLNGHVLLYEGGNAHNTESLAGLLVLSGSSQYVGSLTGARTLSFTGPGHHLVLGPILNSTNGAPISLTKLGSGSLTLGGVNTYANGTTLGGGTLLVNGRLPTGTLAISNGTTLGGSGLILSAVTVPAGATLAPGAGVGTLFVGNSVSLSAGSSTRMELNKASGSNDQLRVTGLLTYGGTLVVTNLGGQLWAGDSFQLFSAGSRTGAFSSLSLPALPTGFGWLWTPASGTLSVTSSIALNPTNLAARLSGSSLELVWPADHTGWRLEVQTNSLATGQGTNWFTVPGANSTNRMELPRDLKQEAVFYRLVFP
jgi:autotransporter-associated beta strand protein